jgi:hypothetical protein
MRSRTHAAWPQARNRSRPSLMETASRSRPAKATPRRKLLHPEASLAPPGQVPAAALAAADPTEYLARGGPASSVVDPRPGEVEGEAERGTLGGVRARVDSGGHGRERCR